MKQFGSRYVTQASPRLQERPPSKVAGDSQQPRRAVLKRPPHRERAAGRLEPKWQMATLSVSFGRVMGRGSPLPARTQAPPTGAEEVGIRIHTRHKGKYRHVRR